MRENYYLGNLYSNKKKYEVKPVVKDVKVAEVMSYDWFEYMDIVLADFGDIEGDCLTHKIRPAICCSVSSYSAKAPIMQLIPMSKKLKNMDANYHVFIDKTDCVGLNNSGVAMVEQITTLDRAHVRHYIGHIKDERLIAKLQVAIMEQLGLKEM